MAQQLTQEQRYQIYYKYAIEKKSMRKISGELGVAVSTISNEIRRNSENGEYHPEIAHKKALQRRVERGQKGKKITEELAIIIERLLVQKLSPEQISGYLEREGIVSIHYSTIYRFIWEDKKAGGDLYKNLRISHRRRYKRYAREEKKPSRIPHRTSIEERPEVVEIKGRLGDCEGDTIIGKGHKSALFTLVERKTLYTRIIRLSSKNAMDLAKIVSITLADIRTRLKTITFDNGLEFASHEIIAENLDVDIYFAHPYSSWERGVNENINGLIRQYFPKSTDFNEVSDLEILAVQESLNNRPRKSLGFLTPNEAFLGIKSDLLW